ncbi:MAG: hypothetical protein HUU46_13345 [Candidatus Hydrogenedentes bacterium]|nr:hypothetical protein [Candidatus Hydrogenedentota bacterium]
MSDDPADLANGYAPFGVDDALLSAQLREVLPLLNTRYMSKPSLEYARVLADRLENNIPVAQGIGTGGGRSIQRLRVAPERYLWDMPPGPMKVRGVPVMWDKVGPANLDNNTPVFRHRPRGCNVLFADGHVEFQEYRRNGRFPVSNALLDAILSAGLSVN